MKVKTTDHSKKEQERQGLLVPSARWHPGAEGTYWAETRQSKTELNTSSLNRQVQGSR